MVQTKYRTCQAATGITATFSRTGTSGKFVVANASTTALNGWSIRFDLPAGVTVTFTVRAKDTKGTLRAPGNLRATTKDAGSITLAWNTSTDNRGVANYDVHMGTIVEMTVSGTTATVTGLAPSTSYTFTVRARASTTTCPQRATRYTGNQWWTFDDAWSIQRKTAWLRSKNLLGAMI